MAAAETNHDICKYTCQPSHALAHRLAETGVDGRRTVQAFLVEIDQLAGLKRQRSHDGDRYNRKIKLCLKKGLFAWGLCCGRTWNAALAALVLNRWEFSYLAMLTALALKKTMSFLGSSAEGAAPIASCRIQSLNPSIRFLEVRGPPNRLNRHKPVLRPPCGRNEKAAGRYSRLINVIL